MSCMQYSSDELFTFVDAYTGESPTTSYWTNYSDGLPRLKPAGVTAYYVSGFNRGSNPTIYDPFSELYLTELKSDTLPANTGLLLKVDESSLPKLNNGGQAPTITQAVRKYVYFAPAMSSRDVVNIQEGTNFMVPLIAIDQSASNTSENAWRQLPGVKRDPSKYHNMMFGLGEEDVLDADGKKTGEVRYAVGFFRVPQNSLMPTNNYEYRKAFISIPREGSNVNPGDDDQTFSAKSNNRKVSSATKVVTAPIDLIWCPGGKAALTGINNVKTNAVDGDDTGATYNLQGQRVSNPHHGVFIRNGKKVIIK